MQMHPDADSTGHSEPPPATGAEKATVPPPNKATATQFFLKGLAISLPPILTLVIIVWIAQMVYGYVVNPITTGVRFVIAEAIDKSRPSAEFVAATGLPPLEYCGTNYRVPPDVDRTFRSRQRPAGTASGPGESGAAEIIGAAYVPFGEWSVPYYDFVDVAARMRPADWPTTATGLYMELVTIRYFKSVGSLSALATALTIMALYFLGRFVTARMGQWLVSRFETLVLARVPVISSVYASVKQVTDFFFSERPVAYNRVVALEFPRRGIWTIGFAMGESLMEMTLAAGEPLVSVMIPAAPMPMTGWVICVPKSGLIDLNLTLDQAFQFFLSCGVLVPEHQKATPELLHRELARRLAESFAQGNVPGSSAPPGRAYPPTGGDDGAAERFPGSVRFSGPFKPEIEPGPGRSSESRGPETRGPDKGPAAP